MCEIWCGFCLEDIVLENFMVWVEIFGVIECLGIWGEGIGLFGVFLFFF